MTRLGALIAADGLITAAVCCGQLPAVAMLAAWGCGLAASVLRRDRDLRDRDLRDYGLRLKAVAGVPQP